MSTPPNNVSSDPHECAAKKHLERFSRFAGFTVVTNRQTTLHHDVCSSSLHSVLRAVMRLTSTIQHVKFLCSNLLRTMLWRLFFSSTLFMSLTILFYRIIRTLAMPMSVCTASMASPHARAIPASPPSSDVNKTTRFKTKAKTKTIGPVTT